MEGNLKKFIKDTHPSIIWRWFCIFIIIISWARCVFNQSSTAGNLGQEGFNGEVVSAIKSQGQVSQFYVAVDQNIKIRIITNLRNKFSYGDKLQIKCQTYKAVNNFGRQGECSWPQIKILERSSPNLTIYFQKIRQLAYDYLARYLVEPYLSLTVGLLWGDDTNLPSDLKKDFQKTGVSHILAASGYNLMVLSSLLFYLLVLIGLYRKQAAWLVMLSVIFFIFLAGLESAVIRAGVMIGVMIAARLFGQKVNSVNLLLGTAAAMLLFSPQLLMSIGFQLSFIAMVGLMFILPKLKEILNKSPNLLGVKEVVLQTLAANLATWPIIVWHFEKLSLISPVANVAVAPIVNLSFVMAGPIFVLFSLNSLAQVVAWLWQTCLVWLVQMVGWLSKLPGAEIYISKTISLLVSPIYLWLIWKIIKYEKKFKK